MAKALNYFALLGLGEDVNQDELEARYQELADYFSSPQAFPSHLREWARKQAALVDEAYAVLADPERRAAARQEGQAADKGAIKAGAGKEGTAASEPLPKAARSAAGKRGQPAPPVPGGGTRLRPQTLLIGALFGLVVLAAVLFGRYGFPSGGSQAAPDSQQSADALAAADAERVAELIAELSEDPNNPSVLFELGETYFQANDWQKSIDWFTRLLAVDPNNVHARTDIGTSNYNLGNYEAAKAAWMGVLEIDPNDIQAHYNLAFLYANAEPQDLAAAREEWETVESLDPESELAAIARAHLDGLPDETDAEATPAP